MGAIPNLTQFFGDGPVAPPDGVSTDPALDFSIPSPWENPDLHDSVIFTNKANTSLVFTLPPVGMGKVEIKTPVKAKLDNKAGAGKAKPKSTKTGGEATKDKVKIEAIDEAWPYIVAAAMKMQPGSGSWLVSHPAFTMANIHEIEIEEWTSAPKEDVHGFIEWEIKYSEVKPNAQSGTGGGNATETPDATNQQRGIANQNIVANELGNHLVNQNTNPAQTNPNTPYAAQQSAAAKP